MKKSTNKLELIVDEIPRKRAVYDPVGTRKAVIDAAVRLFSEKGFATTSVQEIVEGAEVTKGAFYHHFSSKEDVLLQIRDEIAREMLQNAQNAVDTFKSPKDQLKNYILQGVKSVVEQRAYVAINFQEFHSFSEKGRAAIKHNNKQQETIIRGIIDRGKQAGCFRQELDSRFLTATIPAMITWVYRWYNPSGRLSVTELSSMVCELVLNGVMESGSA